MSKPGYYEVNLERIFNHATGHKVDVSEQLAMDFRRATVVQGANGPELQATFIDPQTGKQIHMGAEDVGRLQQWTGAARTEAYNAYAAERSEYIHMLRDAQADGRVTQTERAALAQARQEAEDAHADYRGFARQDNEAREALAAMNHVGQNYNANMEILNALKPGGLLNN